MVVWMLIVMLATATPNGATVSQSPIRQQMYPDTARCEFAAHHLPKGQSGFCVARRL